jgi:hypothetical protein
VNSTGQAKAQRKSDRINRINKMFGLYILEHNNPVNPVKTDSPRSLPAPWNDFALLFHWGDSVRDKRNWLYPKFSKAETP